MDTNDGGPAFPVLTDKSGGEEFYLGTPGMSLRDWFAGQALAGLCAYSESAEPKVYAIASYALADAMLAARATRPEAPDAQ